MSTAQHPEPVPYDDHEREVLALVDERDQMHELADKLAAAIAPEDVLGEHSSSNDPWANALEYAYTNTAPKYYPHQSGDFTVIGPECFTDGETIAYKGENYRRMDAK